jgi:hypothetical protein
MDDLFSCAACDHPATEHTASGCVSCSCKNPFESTADERLDPAELDFREPLGPTDELRSA